MTEMLRTLFTNLTVECIRDLAAGAGLKGKSGLKKDALIEEVLNLLRWRRGNMYLVSAKSLIYNHSKLVDSISEVKRIKREKVSREKAKLRQKMDALLKGIGAPEPSPFALDDWQIRAIGLLNSGDVLCIAPTGSGKTLVAVEVML